MYNNCRQALELVRTLPKKLEGLMSALGIASPEVFAQWREEEKDYLWNVQEEVLDDVLKMDYLELLLKLKDAE